MLYMLPELGELWLINCGKLRLYFDSCQSRVAHMGSHQID